MRRRRATWSRVAWVAALVLLAGCGAGAESEEVGEAPVRATPVVTRAVTSGPVTVWAELAVDLRPYRRATLAAEVPGTVEEVRADLGDPVREGEVLVRIDTRALAQQVAEAEAVFRQAEDRRERAEKLFERRSITRQDQIDAQASYEVAESRLGSARLALEKAVIRAPWSGRIASRLTEVGDYAAPGTPLVEIVQTDRLRVRATLAASDLPLIRVGAPVTVTVTSLPGESFEGRVTRLGAELDPATRTLEMEAELDNDDGRLKPGLFGRLAVPLAELPSAILVPLSALLDLEDGRAVYVVEDGRATRRRVELGRVRAADVVVTAGLQPGDRVIVQGQDRVSEGQPVVESPPETSEPAEEPAP